MPVTVVNNRNPSTSTPSTPKTPPLAFSPADFAKWNQTTSMLHLPAKLVGKDKIPKVRGEIVKAIGEKKVAAVQALSPTKYRVEFTSSSYRHERDVNGITFRGVTLTPHPAYEEVKSVFVNRAPLQMPDQYLFDLLAPYGHVLSVEHLKIKGFQNVKSGTRRVSMVITKSIPAILKISTLQLSFRYRGQPPLCFVCQEVGHTGKDCPKSRKAHRNTLNADLHPEDLRHKLNNVQEGDLRVKLQKVSQAAPAGAAATSSLSPPSLITADQPSKSNSTPSTTRKSNNKHDAPKSHAPPSNKPNDQPLTDNEASLPSLPSLSSPSLQDTLGKLKEIFHQSTDRTAESAPDAVFATLAKETASAAEQSTASIITVASTTSTGFLVQLNGQVVTAKRPDAAVPQAESFEFSLKPARPLPSSSAATRSAWSDSYKQAVGIHLSGGKGRAASDSRDLKQTTLSR